MTALRAIHIAWRAILVILCLALVATGIRLLIEEDNAAYLFGIFAFGAGAYYAGRDLTFR